jgi:hypothetical protein
MKITINPYDTKSITKAIKELNKYKQWVLVKEKELLKRLAEIGVERADITFKTALYDGINDVEVTYSQVDNKATIYAKGEAVCFIEFGTGVFYNGSGIYPVQTPAEIAGIGEYGKGKGKQKSWGFYMGGDKENLVITHGNPPAMAMWLAEQDIIDAVTQVAREVFR